MVMSNSTKLLSQFQDHLNLVYTVKWTTQPTLYLGIQIKYVQEDRTLSLTQTHYIESVLDRFAMTNCNPAKTPLTAGTILVSGSDEEIKDASQLPYQSLIGCLQWISNSTRPDISHAVSQLSRFNANWTTNHWLLAKHVLRYLKGSSTLGINFGGTDGSLKV